MKRNRKPPQCPKCLGVLTHVGPHGIPPFRAMAEHDAKFHPTHPLTIQGDGRHWEFPRAETLSVTPVARSEAGGIYVITVRAVPDADGIECIERFDPQEA